MRVVSLAISVVAVVAAGCSESAMSTSLLPMSQMDAGGDDATLTGPTDAGDNGQVSTMYPAPFPAPPQVAEIGGPVLASPRMIPVFFANDDAQMTSQITDFSNKVGATQYWKAVSSEYGIGPATAAAPVQLSEMATGTLSDATIKTWLAGKLNANDPLFPKADKNSLYMLYYPDGLTITLPSQMGTSQSCRDFGGYHGQIKLDAQHGHLNVAYAVMPRCADFAGMSGIDAVTSTASHELIEASTDPYPESNPDFAQVDDDHIYWGFILGGGEVGDLCAQDPTAFTKFPELPYTVQRSWSNAAVMNGDDPCVPALPKEVFFNAVPEMTDPIALGGGQFTALGIQIDLGTSKTIDLDLYSNGKTNGPWTVKVQDAAVFTGGAPSLSFSLDRNKGQNGEKLHLTIKAVRAGRFGGSFFFITSTLGNQSHSWLGLVGN